ncbi:NmrA family NAD(P)-binding protein [Nocardia takedensis]|uniref:NmrA family NAD(P)-binding protein n=1 Tax=Nocardia takedensis TaxID=259390 RepID=UPI00030BA8F7|nr:NmrA family NAD(P)-binding protein [Nocardia takedensis]
MSVSQAPVLVTGVTGNQGGATARLLLTEGVAVRALVRDPAAPVARELAALGAELAVGDFDDPDSLAAATAGARAVFGMPPATYGPGGWDVEVEARRGIALVEAAVRAEVEQFVFSGVATFTGPHRGAAGKERIEEHVVASGLRYTLLRPVRFMENYLSVGFPIDGVTGGVHRHLFPTDRPTQMIAVADIAVFAALAFADPDGFHGRVLELAGDAVTMGDAAAAIAAATGHPLRYSELTEAQADELGPDIGAVWRRTREGDGWHADIPALREIHPGLRTFTDWLTESGADRLKPLLAG